MATQETNKKKSSISELAHINTLSPEEMAGEEEEILGNTGSSAPEGEEEGRSAKDYMPAGMQAKEAAKVKRMEHTEPSFVISATPTEQTMFEFMLYHSYANVMGVISVILGLGAIVMVVVGIIFKYSALQIVLFGAIGAMFLANSPITLKRRARKQAEMLRDPKNTITYTFSDEGFDMARGENEYADFSWDRIYKIKEGKSGFYMYLERNRAFVIPTEAVAGVTEFRSLLKRHVTQRLSLLENK